MPDNPYVDSDSQETFGRFNNVDISYDVRLGSHPQAARADIGEVRGSFSEGGSV